MGSFLNKLYIDDFKKICHISCFNRCGERGESEETVPVGFGEKAPQKKIGSEDQPMEQVDGDDDHFRMTSFSTIKCAMLI